MTPKRVLSSIPKGNERENIDEVELLRRKYRKALNPTPIEGIDVGDSEEVLDPQIKIPDQSDFELPTPLQDVVGPSKVTHKFLPKQAEIDRLINQINKKVLRDTKRNMNLRDLRTAYLTSPHFRDIYLNVTQNKVPLGKGAARRLEQNARNYVLLDDLLFKITELDDGRLDTVICIPTSKVHILLDTYHSCLLGGHTGITKCYQTISQRFYCTNLAENLRAYICGAQTLEIFIHSHSRKASCSGTIHKVSCVVPYHTSFVSEVSTTLALQQVEPLLLLIKAITEVFCHFPSKEGGK